MKGAKANSKVTIKGGRHTVPVPEDYNQLKTIVTFNTNLRAILTLQRKNTNKLLTTTQKL